MSISAALFGLVLAFDAECTPPPLYKMKLPTTEDLSVEGAKGNKLIINITRLISADIDGDGAVDCAAVFTSEQGQHALFVRASRADGGRWSMIRPDGHVSESDSLDLAKPQEIIAHCESDEECLTGEFIKLTLKTKAFLFSGIGTAESIIYFDEKTKSLQQRFLTD